MTKIAYIGNYNVDFTTESHVALSLEELGCQVIRLQENDYSAEHITEICRTENPDMLLWTRTWSVNGDAKAMLNSLLCPSVAYHLDLYAGLQRNGNINFDPWWKCDFVFSADGGSPEYFKEHGVNHFWSPPAVYGKECYITEPVEEYKSEILFTGSYTNYHGEWKYRQLLINTLLHRYGNRFKIVEHGSPGAPWRGHKLNQLYASSKVVIGDSLCIGFTHEKYWSDRTHEVPGRGGMLIAPYITPLDDFYEPGREMVFYPYGDFDNLFSLIDFYLEHDAERESIRLAGHERTKCEHTYVHRLKNVLDVVLHGKKNIYDVD